MAAKQEFDNALHLPKIHTGLLNSQTLNCHAALMNETYFIGMSSMIPIALLELAAYFFSEDDFYPEIGNADEGPQLQLDGVETVPLFQIAENRFRPRTTKKLSEEQALSLYQQVCMVRGHAGFFEVDTGRRLNASEYLDQYDTLIDFLLPVCQLRRAHCQYLADIMAHFFWFHEIAHVTSGHLKHLQNLTSNPLINLCEFPDLRSPNKLLGSTKFETPPYVSLELDADLEAALITIGTIMIDADIESDEFPYENKYKRVELFVFMLVSVMTGFAKRYDRSGLAQSQTHPCARMRLVNILTYLNNFSDADEQLEASIHQALDRVFTISKYPKFDYLRSAFRPTDEQLAELRAIDEARTSLPQGWDEYSYFNLRPVIGGWLNKTGLLDSFRAMLS